MSDDGLDRLPTCLATIDDDSCMDGIATMVSTIG